MQIISHFKLHKYSSSSSVPEAAIKDKELHKLLALTDAIRIGKAREKQLATAELKKIFS